VVAKKILVRVDGGSVENIGTGHIFRCLLLGSELRGRGTLIFASLDSSEFGYGHAQIKKQGHDLCLLPPDQYHDALRELVSREDPDFVICDLYEYEEEELKILKASGAPLMTFDHVGSHRQCSDYPINAVVPRPRARYEGLDYIVISPPDIRPFRQTPEKLFVCFGGFDYGDLTFKVASALVELDVSQHVSVVVTSLYPHVSRLRELAANTPVRVAVHEQPDNFARLLSECDIACVSGGLTMFQTLSIGVSVVAISQYEHQRQTIEDFKPFGAYVDAGAGDRFDGHRFKEVLAGLVSNAAQRRELGDNARRMVDGRGLERVVRLVADELDT
jgi:spore coat polysaccharide biosynthesis predicted glycosyltransferase SpsG